MNAFEDLTFAVSLTCALAACSQTPTPCERNEDCASGLFCRFTAPGSECAHPRCDSADFGGGECHCGVCTAPSTSIVECGAAKEGDPCDEAEWRGFVCRAGSCTSYCLPQCSCYDGRWHCDKMCNDFCEPMGGDGGWGCLECGVAPKCVRSCGAF